jgi:multiple sugar transport system substrate-binding protein
MSKRILLIVSLLIVASLVTSCGPPPVEVSGVTIQFWHVYGEGDPRNEAMVGFVDDFNANNEYGITVEALDQGQYSDLEDKVNAGIQSGDLPHVAQAYTSALYNWDTVDLVVDLNQFVSDKTYGLSQEEVDDIYPAVFNLGINAEGERLAWPLSQSANALVYNFTWAKELGFDSAPTTPEELKEQLCAAAEANATDDNPDNDGTGGFVYSSTTSDFLGFLHAFGGDILTNDGTAYEFNTPEAKAAALFINDLRDNGCTFETESYPNPEQANRLALVTASSTSGLPYYGYAFADANNEDEWGFLPFPGPDGGKGTVSWSQTMGILKSTPEQEMASWIFMKFLTSPEIQAKWIEASGYLPTHFSTEGMLTDYVASVPQYQSTMEIASLGQAEPEIAAWFSVRRALEDSVAMMYAAESDAEIDTILAELDVTAAELVAEVE